MSQPSQNGRPLTVLIVDDDAMNLRVAEEILAAFGHRAVRAISGPEALQHLACQAFDVVLMDIHMPGMTGVEALTLLRRTEGPGRDTPVIAVTADVLTYRPDEYLGLGFDGFIAKPILVSVMMATLASITGGAAPVRQAPPQGLSHTG